MESTPPNQKIIELDIKRIQALTDGVFAIVITLLAIEIRVPKGLDGNNLVHFLSDEIIPQLLIFFLSFIIVGAFWVDAHFHHHLMVKTDRVNIWLNILFLMFICLIPFSSDFLAHYQHATLSIIVYSSNLICASLCHLLMLVYSWKKQFIRPYISLLLYNSMRWRILLPIIVYIIIIPLAFLFSKWIIFLFLAPLGFQIIYGRSKKETRE